MQDFKKVFTSLGKLLHVETVNKAIQYYISASQQVPIPLLKPLRQELKRMQELGVTCKGEEPSDWFHPILLTPKLNGLIRFCIDLTNLNAATKHKFYHLDDTTRNLSKIRRQLCSHFKIRRK